MRSRARLAGTRHASLGRALACVLVVLAAACEPTDGPDPSPGDPASLSEPVVRDSAGIRIVENPEQAPDPTGWWVDTVPSLVIGDDETRGDEHLFAMVADAARLPDGRIVVADFQLQAVRLYDASGNFLRLIGRAGSGPGEYPRPCCLFLVGDTIVVDGGGTAPASYFTPDGEFVRRWSGPGDGPARVAGPYGFFADGTVLGRRRVAVPSIEELAEPLEAFPLGDSARFVRLDADGAVVSDYGTWVTERAIMYFSYQRLPFGGPAGDQMEVRRFQYPHHLPQPVIATRGMELYRSEGDRFEILVYDADANLRRIVRKADPPVPVPRELADELWSGLMAQAAGTDVAAWLTEAEPPPLPDRAPALDRLLVDDLGNLWVRRNPPGGPDPPTWFVFDTTGALTNSVSMELDPLQIGADFVLATLRGEFGVPHVALFPLRKE